jgi:hypothetical protein
MTTARFPLEVWLVGTPAELDAASDALTGLGRTVTRRRAAPSRSPAPTPVAPAATCCSPSRPRRRAGDTHCRAPVRLNRPHRKEPPTMPATNARPDTVTGWAVDCPVCDRTGAVLSHLDEAEQLAAVHDHLHHRGIPTAAVTPVGQP